MRDIWSGSLSSWFLSDSIILTPCCRQRSVLTGILFVLLAWTTPMAWAADGDSIAKTHSPYPILRPNSGYSSKQIKHGEYLVRMGDCLTCHTDTANNGKAFAGGLKIDTKFGAIYTPNITPDQETGIGQWSDAQFVRAVREGIAPDGSYYYPVFPYNYFNKMSVQDVLDIKAYLDAVPAVRRHNHRQELHWPFNYRFLQWGWRLLYFDFNRGVFKESAKRSELWNRGAFIVEGPGHCALCHTKLNYFGVPISRYYLSGTFVEGYYAPNITSQGLKRLSKKAVADIFLHDKMPTRIKLSGPMKDVEHNSLRYLDYGDMLAIASYLKSIKSEEPPVEKSPEKPFSLVDGKKLYQSNCIYCHGTEGTGAPQVNRQVWDVLLNQRLDKLYEVAIRGDGNMPAKGGCDTCANGRVKAAVDYMIKLSKKIQHTTAAPE